MTLPTPTQILITREFNAPKERIYQAWTTPALIKQWWGATNGNVIIADVDLRVGGAWRWVLMTEDGTEVGFHGEYQTIIPNERLVFTEIFEGMPEAGAVTTVTLSESAGRTTATLLVEHSCQEHRDGHINSGMESGMQASLDHLERVVLNG